MHARHFNRIRRLLPTLLALLALLLTLAGPPAPAARAATFNVTNLNDSGHGSLRQAILDAQDAPAAQIINFDSSIADGTIVLSSTLPIITSTVTIDGTGLNITISGNNSVRVFDIGSGSLTLRDVTIARGSAATGGGIYNQGTLVIDSGTFFSNTATADGGGIHSTVSATLIVTDALFIGNQTGANGRGGAIFSDSTIDAAISGSTLQANTAKYGGALLAEGSHNIAINNSLLVSNTAESGGGVYHDAAGLLTITGSSFADNSATDQGGGIFTVSAMAIEGTTFSGNRAGLGGAIANLNPSGQLTVTNSAFWANGGELFMLTAGGGILGRFGSHTTVIRSAFSGNTSDYGGALYSDGLSAAVITSTTFYSNTGMYGGGIFTGGTLSVFNSTLHQNHAARGGGVYLLGDDATGTIVNSTLYSNTVYQEGGGIALASAALTITHSTLAYNGAELAGGGIHNSGSVSMRNTIVAHSPFGGNCAGDAVSSDGENLTFPGTSCPGLSADPLLGPLTDNGGPTLTMALLPGSPAVDAAVLIHCPPNDQRGVARPQGSSCDIGAFERIVFRLFLPMLRR